MSAAEADTSGDIVIKGGSCEIEFDDGVFDLAVADKKQKHNHKEYKIHRIVITGNQKFNSGEIDGGFRGEIRISYYKPKA
jgi:hypothetical protein